MSLKTATIIKLLSAISVTILLSIGLYLSLGTQKPSDKELVEQIKVALVNKMNVEGLSRAINSGYGGGFIPLTSIEHVNIIGKDFHGEKGTVKAVMSGLVIGGESVETIPSTNIFYFHKYDTGWTLDYIE